MKSTTYIYKSIICICLAWSISSCEDFLEEENPSELTIESYIDQDNADQLILGIYDAVREAYKQYEVNFLGTDIFTVSINFQNTNELNDYLNINASQAQFENLWIANYTIISNANTAINRYENEIVWEEGNIGERDYGIAQAKALRALAYYNLVQQFGGVVVYTEEIDEIRYDYERSSEEETLAFIIEDLEVAIPDLEESPSQFGRFSSRAAQHLLADVYLTRGYKDFGSSSDFTTAASLAEDAINGYDIRSQSYEELFDYGNQLNDEVLFSVQYGASSNAIDANNNKHAILMNGVINYPGVSRVGNPYGVKLTSLKPTDYFYSLFADNDTRDGATFHRAIIADEEAVFETLDPITLDSVDVTISAGDTVVFYPKNALDQVELEERLNRYWVYQPDEYNSVPDSIGVLFYYNLNLNNNQNFPIFKKFDDETFNESGEGHRDTYVFRVAETHLIAAEAYLQAGNTGEALSHINVVRERATGETDFYTTLTIDDILDERALELAGESSRWHVLKRTGKLEERINLYNPHVIDHGGFNSAIHLLRPIPTSEMALGDNLIQNFGY